MAVRSAGESNGGMTTGNVSGFVDLEGLVDVTTKRRGSQRLNAVSIIADRPEIRSTVFVIHDTTPVKRENTKLPVRFLCQMTSLYFPSQHLIAVVKHPHFSHLYV